MRTQQHHCFVRVFFALQLRAAATSPPPAPPLVDSAVRWMKINLEKHGSTRADTGFKNEMCVHVPRAREQTRGASLLSRSTPTPAIVLACVCCAVRGMCRLRHVPPER